MSELLKVFRKCRKLEVEIPCSDDGEVTEEDMKCICKVLPCRDVDVYVGIGDGICRYPN